MDPLADKYPGWSPYNYVLGNPLTFIDPNGDSVLVSGLTDSERSSLIGDLVGKTGLPLFVTTTGKLGIIPSISINGKNYQLYSAYGNAGKSTSTTASDFLTHAISSKTDVNIVRTTTRGSKGGGELIKFNFDQVSQFINGVSDGLNNTTMGFAMTFFHELTHTYLGQSFYKSAEFITDDDGTAMGQVVPKMNIIRSELGPGYGQRTKYQAMPGLANMSYFEFGEHSITFVKNWMD